MGKEEEKIIVVLGATGYVGGRLVERLLKEGYRIRACSRSLGKLKSRVWAKEANIELFEVDVLNESSLQKVCLGAHAIYYLVHSMDASNNDFSQKDRDAALMMNKVSEACDVKRIIYLGGLGETNENLSKHLSSRLEVGEILKEGVVPVTILRAAMIIGSGSASFEILRYLVDRLPIMITPRWVRTRNQPIAIRNVIEYLAGCLAHEETTGEVFDIGGLDVLTYQDLMDLYASVAGLPRRFVIPVPVLTPRLSSHWIHFVTPVPNYIARPLTEGLVNEVVCQDNRIRDIIPQKVLSCREAIQYALALVHDQRVVTYWADAGVLPKYAFAKPGDAQWSGGTILTDYHETKINTSKDKLWKVISSIGGQNGWYHGNWLWCFRGWLDKLCGGVGLRRGRRDPIEIAEGDVLDFWRVLKVEKNKMLLLGAEMKLPGIATLEFKIQEDGDDLQLIQKAQFRPKGLFGMLYWYSLVPSHWYIFGGMIKAIKRRAEKIQK